MLKVISMATPAKKVHMYPIINDASINIDVDSPDKGFISLFRSIRKHWIWQDPVKLKWWIDILLEVNHKPKKVLLGSRLIDCNRGQSVNSLQTWAIRWRTNVSAVRRFFALLETDKMIVTENVSKTTRITVCKYESYQDWRHDSETIMKRKRNDDEKIPTPNNNGNNDNKEESTPPPPKKLQFTPPTIEEVKAYFKENGYTEESADKAFKYYSSANWKDSKGNQVKSWKQKMISVWFKDENKISSIGTPQAGQRYINKNSFI